MDHSPPTIHFVHTNRDRWPDGILGDASWDALYASLTATDGSFNWTLQTFVRLRDIGCDVRLEDRLTPGAMNVLHYDHLSTRSLPFRAFIIAFRADRGAAELADLQVVQNQLNVTDATRHHWMPHWPQPGLVPRDPGRGDRMETVGFLGKKDYLAPQFQSDAFQAELAAMGMRLAIRESHATWSDYSDVDVVLAVRQVSEFDLSIKPASKLINAWHAGSVALLGREPAYRQVGAPGEDYLEIADAADALAALRRLRDDPALRRRLVDNGRRRADAFSVENIAVRWRDWLCGPATAAYRQWQRRGGPLAPLVRASRFPARALRHRRARQYFFDNI